MPNAVLLLAAGASTRLGRPKQLVQFRGQSLLRRAAETAVQAAAGAPVVVVTGALHEELLPELGALPLQVVRCPEWERGMGASLKTGLRLLDQLLPSPSGVLVMLCDQPLVTPQLLLELQAAQQQTTLPIVASAYAGTQGVPVLFAAAAVPLLRQLPDAGGAGQLLKRHAAQVTSVVFPAGALDVDTPEQAAALQALE
ncbi:nucleotidyltransferase family protein [Hymenobacter endophyticus]|uniref:Nucleotidyltransferase family protein n=1 Tax=Hymenobacter endophyticus TaxID=3076335 RepID=A0ABU3TK20_9BACT|nr:nucleotidyltransferase family protein [Hymenobacter endophyticus]MDU0371565.1 nucleotidyltransferase family protein [Hymenobacter endophyticus]